MRIEIGKTYWTRDGRKATVVSKSTARHEYPFMANVEGSVFYFTESGNFFAYGKPTGVDLVGEVKHDQLPPDPAAEALELLNIDRAQLDTLNDRADGKADLNLAIDKVSAKAASDTAALFYGDGDRPVAGLESFARDRGFIIQGEDDDSYDSLREVLEAAYAQAATGKGKQRHANGKPFDRQPIMELGRMTGAGGTAFQAMKKIQEACGMLSRGEFEAAERELLGAINYSAATVLLSRELLSREKSRA